MKAQFITDIRYKMGGGIFDIFDTSGKSKDYVGGKLEMKFMVWFFNSLQNTIQYNTILIQ